MQIVAEEAQRVLKDLIFQTWSAADCESHADTLKMVLPLTTVLLHVAVCLHAISIYVKPLRGQAWSLQVCSHSTSAVASCRWA
jgi:hypothetical protein